MTAYKKPLAMISQGMNGKSDEEILEVRKKAIEYLESLGYEVINTFHSNNEVNIDDLRNQGITNFHVYYLAKSLFDMAKCEAVCFTKDWNQYRGCSVEHKVAGLYGLDILYYEE